MKNRNIIVIIYITLLLIILAIGCLKRTEDKKIDKLDEKVFLLTDKVEHLQIPEHETIIQITPIPTPEPVKVVIDENAFYALPVEQEPEEIMGGRPFQLIDCPLDEELQTYIYYMCDTYGLDFHFVMGLIDLESDFDINCFSATNDYGLMQINICNHGWLKKKFGITDFFDPYQNVLCGCYMLSDLFAKYDDTDLILMAYNMGDNTALRLWKQGIHETSYSRVVKERIANLKVIDEEP